METGMEPGHIRALEGCLGTHGHRKGAQAHTGSGQILSPEWHQNGARAHMGTGRVPGHIWAPEG